MSVVSVPSGLLCVFKPTGWSSARVVSRVKYLLGGKVAVGHGGTLDPLAEGVLVLGIGRGTKLLTSYLKTSKAYIAVGCLGAEYDTQDSTGSVVEMIDSSHITDDQIESCLQKFRGETLQVPPMYSALKFQGKKLYQLARQGKVVERQPRPVHVYHLALRRHAVHLPQFSVEIECAGGYYVRTLISDLGKACGVCAYMTSLTRTKQGPFVLTDCLTQQDWNQDGIIAQIKINSQKVGLANNDQNN